MVAAWQPSRSPLEGSQSWEGGPTCHLDFMPQTGGSSWGVTGVMAALLEAQSKHFVRSKRQRRPDWESGHFTAWPVPSTAGGLGRKRHSEVESHDLATDGSWRPRNGKSWRYHICSLGAWEKRGSMNSRRKQQDERVWGERWGTTIWTLGSQFPSSF